MLEDQVWIAVRIEISDSDDSPTRSAAVRLRRTAAASFRSIHEPHVDASVRRLEDKVRLSVSVEVGNGHDLQSWGSAQFSGNSAGCER
jgi:hypothetical protein